MYRIKQNYGLILRVAKSRKLFLLSSYIKIKCSYRHFNMLLVILTASEDITNQNSCLCPTRFILLLRISLWRHSTLTEIRLWSSFDSQRSQRNKTQIVKKYLSRLLGSVIVNFETLPHLFLPSYSRPPLP